MLAAVPLVVETPRDAFFRALHPGDDWRDMRARDNTKKWVCTINFPADEIEKVDEFVRQHQNHDVFFGVATRLHRNGGKAEDCGLLHALWIDADFKDQSEEVTRERLRQFPIQPSMWVHSGNGLHPYWLLMHPLDMQDLEVRAKVKSVLKTLARALGGDPASAEPARILRVPGSWNVKYDPPRPIVLEYLDTSHRVSLDDIIAHIGPLIPVVPDRPELPYEHNLAIEERMAKARAWLAKQPPAIEDGTGNNHTYSTCCSVAIGHDLPEDYAFRVLQEWNQRCQPPPCCWKSVAKYRRLHPKFGRVR